MKTIKYYLAATLSLLFLSFLASCQDDEFNITTPIEVPLPPASRATPMVSALVQEENGYWKASNKCVPLVGEGRIVDDFTSGLVTIAGQSGGWFDPLLDTNLTNVATLGANLAEANVLGNQLASVRDLNRVYAGEQMAGFVYQFADPGLLTLDLLKNFWLATYLDGKEQEMHFANNGGDVLGLNLLNIASNNKDQGVTVASYFKKPFNEIKMGISGVDVKVLESFKLYYAFVGENEMKYCTRGSRYFPDSKVHNGSGWTSWSSFDADDVVDGSKMTDGVSTFLVKAGKITIDTGKEIPAGSEVGFVMTGGSLLELGIGSTFQLTTYDENDTQVEEVTTAKVLGLSVIGGGKTATSLITTKPCRQIRLNITGVSVDLGVTTIHYAYVKDPVTVDPTSYFSLSNVTITGNSFRLHAPKNGTTVWMIQQYPENARPIIKDNKMTGMTVDGDYIIVGTFTDADGNSITQRMVITRDTKKQKEGCNQLIGPEFEAKPVAPKGTSGGLIEIDKFKDAANLVDDDWENYATYIGGVGIATNTGIIGIETKKPVNPTKKKIKTGFIIQTTNEFIGADVLKFFVIKLYDNDTKVADQVIDGNGVGDVGLIGSKGNKVRIGFTTNQTFDRIELWTAGVLGLQLREYRIYGAFWEDANANCVSADPSEACIEQLTPTSHGATINYKETTIDGTAEVGVSYNNLGNLLDDNMETGAIISSVANIANAFTVAIKFDEINDPNKNTKIGFIVKTPAGLVDAGLFDHTVIKVYHDNVPVGGQTEGGGVDLDLIGYTGRTFVETTARTTAFDEIRITFGQALTLATNIELSGVFLRRDTDGNGIPDCAEDEENKNTSNINNAEAENEHLCLSDKRPEIRIKVTGGTEELLYNLLFMDYNSGKRFEIKDCQLTNGMFVVPTTDMESGDYFVNITHGGNDLYHGVHVMLHPSYTEWKTDAQSTDWNDWNNWSNGTPWGCTNVVIPSNCSYYPVLKFNKDPNKACYCNNIHFCPGSEVVHTPYLDYAKAWVELSLQSGRYYMLSAPLKAMVTGDMFIPEKLNGNHGTKTKFTNLDFNSTHVSRFTPTVYQRLWSSEANGQTIEGSVKVTPNATLWTPPFNDLAQTYELGMGFSMKAVQEGSYTFRFPKLHLEYSYVKSNGSWDTGIDPVKIERLEANVGRFIYEQAETYPTTANGYKVNVTAKNQRPGKTFIVGNPFMAHIDIKEFLKENRTAVTSVKVYDGNSNNTWIEADGELYGNEEGLAYLSPMQGFFVTTAQEATTLELTFTDAMMVQNPNVHLYNLMVKRPDTRSTQSENVPAQADVLRIYAYTQGVGSSCLVRMNSKACDGYQPGEDSRLLVDNELPPIISVFTEADGQALDIQQISQCTEIPLGFQLKSEANVVLELNHTTTSHWKEWQLWDQETGRYHALDRNRIQVDLGKIKSHAGRFWLVKQHL